MHRRTSPYHTTTFTTTTVKIVAVVLVLGMVIVRDSEAATSPSPAGREPDLRRLWERVTSHTETLRNINWYLKQTDIFWVWFQENKGRLDELLSGDTSSPPPNNDRLLQRLEDLERKQKNRDEALEEMRAALQEERRKTNRLEARIRHQEESEDILRREIPKLEERMAHLETQLAAVNQTTLGNKRVIDGRVTTDIHHLKQKTENLMERVDDSQSTSRDEMDELRGLLQGVMLNTVFPLEDQLKQLNQSQLELREDTNEDFIEVREEISLLSARVTSKQGGNPKRRGLQNQITELQTSVGSLQGKVSNLDGRISGSRNITLQQDQLQEAVKEHARIQVRLSRLEKASGDMNLEVKKTTADVEQLQRDVTNLKQYSNLTDHIRTVRLPTPTSESLPPVGPPSSLSSGSPSYPGRRTSEGGLRWPGNQGWRGEPGDPGSRGAPGTPGAPGIPGSRGVQGSPGAPGGRGAPGSPGTPGDRGAPGSPGPRGEQGSPGAPGGRGTPGSRGAPGSMGAPGNRGASGNPGSRGAPGSSGSSGVRGSSGLPGNAGLRGPPGGSGRRGSQGQRGAPGRPGAPGAPGRRGAAGEPGYPGSPGYTGYPGFRGYTSTSSPYGEYPASPSYTRYRSSAGYGGYY